MPEIITPQEILPHPLRGTIEIGSERIMPVFGKIRSADGASDDNPVLTIVGTDGSEDRHGSVINPRGWKTADYMRNPVVLWSHGAVPEYPSLGETIALRSVGGKWEFDIRFALGPWRHMRDNLAAFLWEYYRDFGGVLASSISFIPTKWVDREATTIPSFFAENVEYREQELTEISFVNVPSNRNALTKAVERARSAGTMTEGLAKMLGFAVSPIVLRSQPEAPVTSPADSRPDAATFRTTVQDLLSRCCGCEPYYNPTPVPEIDEETKGAEIATINQFASECLDSIDSCLNGWKTAKHEELRNICSSSVYSNMYMFDRLAYLLKEWYGEEIGATVPDINFDDVERVLENFEPRAQQVVIQNAADLAEFVDSLRVRVNGTPAEEIPGALIRIQTGDESRELDANATITVLAPDAPSDRNGDRPSPGGDLYRVLLAD